jgi:density-regulated protein DRP1
MPAKRKPAKKEESSSSSDSDSDSDSSSSGSEEAAPKTKASAKGKSKAKAKAKAEEKEDKDEEEKPAKDAEDGGDSAEKAEEGEKKEEAFKPPERPVFKPHDQYPDIVGSEEITYCPICGLPPDFCQYGTSWDKCKPVCMEKFPQYYPELCGVSLDDAKKAAEAAADKGKVKELPGGKKKREASPSITIKKLTRGGRKCVTSVQGLELFGVKLDDAAKKFKKKFACGTSVVKGENGLSDTVDIQGDFEDEVVDLIVAEFKIPDKKSIEARGRDEKERQRPIGSESYIKAA